MTAFSHKTVNFFLYDMEKSRRIHTEYPHLYLKDKGESLIFPSHIKRKTSHSREVFLLLIYLIYLLRSYVFCHGHVSFGLNVIDHTLLQYHDQILYEPHS